MFQQQVIKQPLERHKRRIAIRNPQQQHLFKRNLAIRPPVFTRALQPLFRRQLSAIHIHGRELLHKSQQQPLTLRRRHLRAQPLHCSRHHGRVLLPPILRHQHMTQFIDHPHRKQRARIHLPRKLLFRRLRLCPRQLIQILRQLPRGSNIRKNNIPRKAEQDIIQVQPFTDRS